jgi:hypothetical protein
MNEIIIERGRTKVITVSFPDDISDDVITSQIREGKSTDSELIAEWAVTLDAEDVKEAILTIDDVVTADISQKKGYMDIKQVMDGEPTNAFDGFIIVKIIDPITE